MAKSKKITSKDYAKLLSTIKERIKEAQYQALKTVNKELISLYWDIGKLIIEKQKDEKWGRAVVEHLATDLQSIFEGMKGFSARNIWYMRNFYLSYHNKKKLQALTAEISWTSNTIILERCKDPLEREFYIKMAGKYAWSSRILINNIENKTYERTLLNQTNFDKSLPADIKDRAKLAVKDEYTFDFLELGDDYSERELENAITSKIDHFLKEMGGIFAFIGRQYRLEIDDKEYFIDLLLYNRSLKCLVAIELKIGEFIPEYVGKMQFYLSALDDSLRMKNENPSIGIILCKSKRKTTVEYALREARKPIGVATYTMVKNLPKELKGQLPTVAQIEKLIDKIDK